jgi:hypothetical protein
MKQTKDWKWFGNAGHFICGDKCQFHLTTLVGKYLVSTVGQYWPERGSREIHAEIYDPRWHVENKHLLGDDYDFAYMKRFGFENIGCDRTFETMVFKAGKPCESKDCGCGQPSISGSELDFEAYKNSGDAATGHMKLCKKWDKKK